MGTLIDTFKLLVNDKCWTFETTPLKEECPNTRKDQ